MCVRPSVSMYRRGFPERIFVRFLESYEKSAQKPRIWLKTVNNIGLSTSRRKYVYIVDSIAKCFFFSVVQQQRKGSSLLHFDCNTERVGIVDSYM